MNKFIQLVSIDEDQFRITNSTHPVFMTNKVIYFSQLQRCLKEGYSITIYPRVE